MFFTCFKFSRIISIYILIAAHIFFCKHLFTIIIIIIK